MANQRQQIGQPEGGAYVSVDALLQLRHLAGDITLEASKKSIASMEGDSHSRFRGRGMEFAEVRPYHPGDDVRTIDWRVTARTQKPYTKLFQEERERPVYLLVDQRANMFFGSRRQFKSVLAANLAAVIAWAGLNNNDRIGALVFSDTEQSDSRARRGKHAVLSLIHRLHEFNTRLKTPFTDARSQHLHGILQDIRRVAKPGSSVYLISDFHDFDKDCREPLVMLARHCDVSAFHIYDELEWHLPAEQQLAISNGRQKLNLLGQTRHFSQQFAQSFTSLQHAVSAACAESRSQYVALAAGQPLAHLLSQVFAARGKAKGRAR